MARIGDMLRESQHEKCISNFGYSSPGENLCSAGGLFFEGYIYLPVLLSLFLILMYVISLSP